MANSNLSSAKKESNMDGLSEDISKKNIADLARIFPEAIDENNKINWAELKATLGEDIELGERYGLSWKGKSNVFAEIQKRTSETLRPNKEKSQNWDKTQNMFITGDNLVALKILHKSYYGKVKMIYIDPPYNTGNDFVYNDHFAETKADYRANAEDYDEAGNATRADGLVKNSRDSGHFHSNWLNMMYPRLFLARNLLRSDGVIFVSIDDNEVANLRLIMDEIFGAENFISQMVWRKKGTSTNVAGTQISALTEYILVYGKSENAKLNQRRFSKDIREYKHHDGIGNYRTTIIEKKSVGDYDRASMKFEILGRKPREGKRWQIGCEKAKKLEKDNRFIVENNIVKLKIYDFEDKDTFAANPNLLLDYGSTQTGQTELNHLLDGHYFDNPKPASLIKHFVELATYHKDEYAGDNIVMDFFGGSGTTAQAVAELNAEDGGNRRWILVQLPEETDDKSEARKAGFETIADIAPERIRLAKNKIIDDFDIIVKRSQVMKPKTDKYNDKSIEDIFNDASQELADNVDFGFRTYEITDSSFKKWNTRPTDTDELRANLLDHLEPLVADARDEDLLAELLLKNGVSPMSKIINKGNYYLAPNNLIICLSRALTPEIFSAMLAEKPKKIILLDLAFQNDSQLKANLLLSAEREEVGVEVV